MDKHITYTMFTVICFTKIIRIKMCTLNPSFRAVLYCYIVRHVYESVGDQTSVSCGNSSGATVIGKDIVQSSFVLFTIRHLKSFLRQHNRFVVSRSLFVYVLFDVKLRLMEKARNVDVLEIAYR